MTNDEMVEAVDAWLVLLPTQEEALAYEAARMEAEAFSAKAEYWFMKGWVARGA